MNDSQAAQDIRWLEFVVAELRRLVAARHGPPDTLDPVVALAIAELESELEVARSRLGH